MISHLVLLREMIDVYCGRQTKQVDKILEQPAVIQTHCSSWRLTYCYHCDLIDVILPELQFCCRYRRQVVPLYPMKVFRVNGVTPPLNSLATEGVWKFSHTSLFTLRYGASCSHGMEGYVNPRAGLDTWGGGICLPLPGIERRFISSPAVS
jgi:hypothetical protein